MHSFVVSMVGRVHLEVNFDSIGGVMYKTCNVFDNLVWPGDGVSWLT